MKKIKVLIETIIKWIKLFFNKKTKEEPTKPTEVRRLTYTKRTDK